MTVLNKKLVRTIKWSWGQALATAIVVLCGTAGYLCLASVHKNLLLTRDTYYAQYRFADFEIYLERAPMRAADKLETVAGVRQVRGRIVKDVTVDIENVDEPRAGRLISMPARHDPVLNDVCLTGGRYFSPEVKNEVILSDRFAKENKLEPGSTIQISVNNKKHRLRVAGLGLSPEYVYMLRNVQELIPDPKRFGILWVPEDFAESALSMDGACNNIIGAVDHPNRLDQVLDDAEVLLKPYGVFGKTKREHQMSHRFLAEEIAGLKVSANTLPIIFMAMASMILLVLLNRMVRNERTEIGLLKAFGYSNVTIAGYYLKYALVLTVAGCIGGFLVGLWMASGLIRIYIDFYHFPLLVTRIYPEVVFRSMGLAFLAALLGALSAVRRVVGIQPAESMRAEAPRYARRIWLERFTGLWRRLSFSTKMITRNASRNAFRAMLNIIGVMVATGILIMGFFTLDSLDYMLKFQFKEVQREDVRTGFPVERGKAAFHETCRFDHVRYAEPMLQYPVEIRSGWRKREVVTEGLPRNAQLRRLLDYRGNPVDIGDGGLVLSDKLAECLAVKAGDEVILKPLMGKVDKERRVRVSKTVRQYLGMSAYMNIDCLSRLLDEPFAMNAALMRVEAGEEQNLNRQLKDVPGISSVEIKKDSLKALMQTFVKSMVTTNMILVLFAGAIACSLIYNLTTVSLAERQRELASLRVLGFSASEVGQIVYRENFLLGGIGLLLGIPFGMAVCLWLVHLYDTELYRLPYRIEVRTLIVSCVLIALFIAISNFMVRRKINSLDVIEALKARE